jgi:predicted metal-dependent hydrolase
MAEITARKVKFDFPEELDDIFPGTSVVDETYLVAFSLTMPYLEPYLIRTFRGVADRITDPVLANDMRAFIAQEAQHFQNHRRVNEMIKGQLGDAVAAKVQSIESRLEADYRRFTAQRSDRFNLVYAEGFEAMTCAMAMTFFERAGAGTGLGSDGHFGAWQQLWAWHAAEEIEHRNVAFDVYEHLHGSWAYRVVGALRAQWHFQRCIDRFQRVLLASQGASTRPRIPGWLRDGKRRYLRTSAPGYNPSSLEVDPLVNMILALYAPE